ncbi:DUF2939 domain-containing protein [Thiohalocapsa sp. ML1]|jgi:hypothetical protein|uniref:DUF2939 domain-containing protein n=1 Tax=Thiohalocapsa sp. ML1 TaxID=1431688 RepID=UPI000732342A|nr:DUF2939 domain-containing protein [Thiohalocapsa sp. ML1]
MLRILGYLVLLALLGYGMWPYYSLFQLDDAVREADPQAIAPFVDLPAIQASYATRLAPGLPVFEPRDAPGADQVIVWLNTNLPRLGDAAIEQAITLEWVRDTLREAAERTTESRPALLIDGVDFAFFESWNRFVVRIGPLGADAHLVLGLDWPQWRVVDLVR